MSAGAARETFAPIGSNLPDLAGASSMCGRNRGFRACPNPGCTRPTGFGVYATVSRPRMLCSPIRLDTSGSRIGPRKAAGNGGIRTEGAVAEPHSVPHRRGRLARGHDAAGPAAARGRFGSRRRDAAGGCRPPGRWHLAPPLSVPARDPWVLSSDGGRLLRLWK